MASIWSPSTGLLLRDEPRAAPIDIGRPDGHVELHHYEARHCLALVRDWVDVESDLGETVILGLQRQFWLERCTSYARQLLCGVDDSLADHVVEELETLCQTRVLPQALLNRLLVADLRCSEKPTELAQRALAHGFAAIAGVFDALAESQPLLRRLISTWVSIPDVHFRSLTIARQELWAKLAEQGIVFDLLHSDSTRDFEGRWFSLLTSIPVADRVGVQRVGRLLAERLHPEGEEARVPSREEERRGNEQVPRRPSTRRSLVGLETALSQIEAIQHELAAGRDANAAQYLTQLVEAQEPEYAVKSLCNVASRCRDMFRADFEKKCYAKALEIKKDDGWLLTQYGAYLKQVGEYTEATEVLTRAARLANDSQRLIARCTLADIWAQQGDYAKAEQAYVSVPYWQYDEAVRTAVADVHRHQGLLDQGDADYDDILKEWPNCHRALAGKAEIAKNRGQLAKAKAMYGKLQEEFDLDERSRRVYRLAHVHLLKLMNELDQAYKLADTLVQENPFCMHARILRGSIMGLMGREEEAVLDLPSVDRQAAVGEWIQQYVRGLLLLKLERFGDARGQLVERFSSAVRVDADSSDSLLRLAAAHVFLCENDTRQALAYLDGIVTSRDAFHNYVARVLRLHAAVAMNDQNLARQLAEELGPACQADPMIRRATESLVRSDLAEASSVELELLLRAA